MVVGWMAFVEGGIASIVAGCATHPLDLIKVRMQLQGEGGPSPSPSSSSSYSAATPKLGPMAMAAKIVRTEGFSGLFSGVSATLLRQATYSTTRMGLYEAMKTRWEERGGGGFALHKKLAAGLLAGGVGAAVGTPAELAMVRMQADGRLEPARRRKYSGVVDALRRTAQEEGVTALWRGGGPTVVRAMVVTSAQLATYDQTKEEVLRRGVLEEGLALHVVASTAAGAAAALASNPVDVVKTRLMNGGGGAAEEGRRRYAGALDCAIQTVRQEGPLALYKGLLPTAFRQAPFTVLLFVTLERVRALLRPS